MNSLKSLLEKKIVIASAPCRIDMGGTIDIPVIHYPLRYLSPKTFNIAIDMRTTVTLSPFKDGWIKISSEGFQADEYPIDSAPYNHPLGLMFAVAAYFRADGVHIHIESSSPPRSALGGSSTAAVAIIAAITHTLGLAMPPEQIVMLAYQIETNVAGVPCGIQDQLAAAYGGIHAWKWPGSPDQPHFIQQALCNPTSYQDIEKHLLLAYCGIPHESKDINGKWIKGFISGQTRDQWKNITGYTTQFINAFKQNNIEGAIHAMNQEVDSRLSLTPEVLDKIGNQLVQAARNNNCGARFTGAGGGGCLWAMGKPNDIILLRSKWQSILSTHSDAKLLDITIAQNGVEIYN